MRNYVMIPALLSLSVGLAACSHDPNANLESARTNFSSLQSDPQSSKVAALETKDAQDWLNKADKAYMDREDEKKVDQLAYLTNQRVEVAKQTIALRTAESELKNASAQRAQAKLDARDAQIAKLQDFTMLKTIPGEDYKVSLDPAPQMAQCVDGVLVLFDTQQKGLTGVLVDNRKRAVRCMGEETPQQVQ